MIFTFLDVKRIAIGFGPASYFITILNIEKDKSFVDDLDMERGIVSVRVAFVLRSAEIQPIVLVICHEAKSKANVLSSIAALRSPHLSHPKTNPPTLR